MEQFEIRRTRNLRQLLSHTGSYLSAHARELFFLTMKFAAPLVIGACLLSYMLSGTPDAHKQLWNYLDRGDTSVFLAGNSVIYLTGLMLLYFIVGRHMIGTDRKELSDVATISAGIRQGIGHIFISFLIIYGMYAGCLYVIDTFMTGESYNNARYSMFSYFFESFADTLMTHLATILLVPLLAYIGVNAVYVCQRDQVGAFDAIRFVWECSRKKVPKIWLHSAMIMFFGLAVCWMMKTGMSTVLFVIARMNGYYQPLAEKLSLVSGVILELTLLFVTVYYQSAMILLFGSAEDEQEGYYIRKRIEEI